MRERNSKKKEKREGRKKRIGRGDDEVLCRLSGKSRIQRLQGISLYSGWKLEEEEEEEEADDARGVTDFWQSYHALIHLYGYLPTRGISGICTRSFICE